MEAAGIEPASEAASEGAPTCVSRLLSLASSHSVGQDYDFASSLNFARNVGTPLRASLSIRRPFPIPQAKIEMDVAARLGG